MQTDSPLPLRTQLLGLIGWLVLTFAAAGLGALASADAGTFYGQLSRPQWAPPGTAFAPVWSVLYLLMGLAAWLVWRGRAWPLAGKALALFVVQLGANALWTWLFFVWKLGALAFVEILLLEALIIATLVSFWRLHRLAGLLLLPYLAWVSFACVLSYAIWQRNPALLG